MKKMDNSKTSGRQKKLVLARELLRNLTNSELKLADGGLVVQTDHASDCWTCQACWVTDWCSSGRRPEGLVDVEAARGEPIGAYFADACRMEAASVPAFAALRDELLMHGAPADLVARAERSKEDEVRHTRITAALARRFGAQEGAWAEPPEVKRSNQRSLEAIALENAVEGCVNEAYAALLATWQGEHARDPSVRAAMSKIAEDERRHAELAYSVAEWVDTKLDEDTRRRVDDAIDRAACALVHGIRPLSPELVEAGLAPTPGEQANLIDSLLSTLETACSSRVLAARC